MKTQDNIINTIVIITYRTPSITGTSIVHMQEFTLHSWMPSHWNRCAVVSVMDNPSLFPCKCPINLIASSASLAPSSKRLLNQGHKSIQTARQAFWCEAHFILYLPHWAHDIGWQMLPELSTSVEERWLCHNQGCWFAILPMGRFRSAGRELTPGISGGTSFWGAKATDWAATSITSTREGSGENQSLKLQSVRASAASSKRAIEWGLVSDFGGMLSERDIHTLRLIANHPFQFLKSSPAL